jgi:hypothetical protein
MAAWINSGDVKLIARIDNPKLTPREYFKILEEEFSKRDVYDVSDIKELRDGIASASLRADNAANNKVRDMILTVLDEAILDRKRNIQ